MFNLKEIQEATVAKLIKGNLNVKLKGISIDTRTIKRGDLFIAIKGARFDGHDFVEEAKRRGAKAVIISSLRDQFKSLKDINILMVPDTVYALGEIAKFYRSRFNPCIIAVTGTNGKTTAKDMIATILAKRFRVLKSQENQNNQIGLSLTLLRLNKDYKFVVVELGTNHPGEIKRLTEISSPQIGLITNIGPGHLEFFHNLKNVFKEKFQLFKSLIYPAICIYNGDDEILNSRCKFLARAISFGMKNESHFRARNILQKEGIIKFAINNRYQVCLNTLGLFNVYNSLAAISCARILGIENRIIKRFLGEFSFPKGRLQVLKNKSYTIIDDSYNSNPLSLELAIKSLAKFRKKRKILVMADMLELGKDEVNIHESFSKMIHKSGIDILITMGRFSSKTAHKAIEEGMDKVFICNYNDEVLELLNALMRRGDIVLLKGSHAMHLEEVVLGLVNTLKKK
ncbi:MAG: UDP-N-acetylmuramoyl-tripeptide--D-alanyl-D-alanine ligase [Candidatus Omnitrophota bacterium]